MTMSSYSLLRYLCILQLRQYFELEGKYGPNIDVDVVLWLDSRAFQKKSSLRDAYGFVILNSELHDEFDKFKKQETLPEYIEYVELLEFWLKMQHSPPLWFGKQYNTLHNTEMDSLLIDTRDKWGKKSSKYVVPNLQVDTVVISLPVKTALPIKATKSLQHRGDHPLKMQVASIIQTPASVLTFEIQKVQFQKGGADCGLFAIAFATDLCYENNPVNLFCLVQSQ